MLKVFIIGKVEDWKLNELLSNKRLEKIIVYNWRDVKGCKKNLHLMPEIIIEGETYKEELNELNDLKTFVKSTIKDTVFLKI